MSQAYHLCHVPTVATDDKAPLNQVYSSDSPLQVDQAPIILLHGGVMYILLHVTYSSVLQAEA